MDEERTMKVISQQITDQYAFYHGDCVHTLRGMPDNSIHIGVTSVPFPGMWVYTNSRYDMGNVTSIGEMVEQCRFMAEELLRCMVPGRSFFIHLTQGVAQKLRDGYMGLKDFRGAMIDMMESVGWIHYGEITIDKDPQLKAMRTKDHGLMFKSLVSDSAKMHSALADIVLQFQKPGGNPLPIRAGRSHKYTDSDGWVSNFQWILWARPIWYGADYLPGTWREDHNGDSCPNNWGIRETDVLKVAGARDGNDERHLCPLQLGVIDRLINVWSAPGEIVFDPFTGSGSTGYVAIKNNRRFVGSELKASYYRLACKNLENAVVESSAMTLFDLEAA
jgi:hypothetical protein